MLMQTGARTLTTEGLTQDTLFFFAGAAVSWESRKQRTVAMSSTEAEYMALSESTKDSPEALLVRDFEPAVSNSHL